MLCSIDVALGILAVIDGCTRPDHSRAGFAVANGNANIMVGGTSYGYQAHGRSWRQESSQFS
jgi:hypothetical protein